MIRVAIADDQALIRNGLRMILESQADIEVVAEAADGEAAAQVARRSTPDVVLLDIRMPGVDGLEATRRILEQPGTPPKVLVLTTFDLDEYVYEAMRAGAAGFLLKTATPAQLIHAVRAVVAGDILLAPEITRRMIDQFVSRPAPGHATPLDRLTEREAEVLRLVAQGLSNADIGEQLFLSEATIKTHINRILTKLGLQTRVQAVVAAYETGFIIPGGH